MLETLSTRTGDTRTAYRKSIFWFSRAQNEVVWNLLSSSRQQRHFHCCALRGQRRFPCQTFSFRTSTYQILPDFSKESYRIIFLVFSVKVFWKTFQDKRRPWSREGLKHWKKKNGFPFLDILGYLRNTHKNPKLGRVRQVPIRELGTTRKSSVQLL